MSVNFCRIPPPGAKANVYVEVTMEDATKHTNKEVAEFVIAEGLSRMHRVIPNFNTDMVEYVWIVRDFTDKCFFRLNAKMKTTSDQ